MDPRASIRKAQEEAKDKDNGCHTCVILGIGIFSTFLMLCLVLAGVGLGIAELVMGSIYFHDCELEPKLPIFLIVSVCTSVVFACRCGQKSEGFWTPNIIIRLFGAAFQISWLIAGTIWVVKVRNIIYAPGHCQQMSTMMPMTTPDITTSANQGVNQTQLQGVNQTQLQGVNQTLLILATLGIDQSTVAGPKVGPSQAECLTCNEALTDFTVAVVSIHWILAALTVILLLLIGLNYLFIKRAVSANA